MDAGPTGQVGDVAADDTEMDNLAADNNGPSSPAETEEEQAEVPEEGQTAVTQLRRGNALPVYVNGSTGSDANAGTEDAPVKTFARARELLTSSGGDTIYVSGALTVSGTETWDLGGKTLARSSGYQGELVHVAPNAKLALGNIVIDGGSESSLTGRATGPRGEGGSLVGVYDGGTLTIGEGAVLQNNTIQSEGHWYPEAGGAVFAKQGTVNVEGGTVRNNSAVRGGGIYGCNDAVINVSDGTITGNRAVDGANGNLDSRYGGSGGGICVFDGADVNFSGGTISGNTAFERGGGISVGTFYASSGQSVLTMTGGTIDGNTAGSSGGGIFVQYGSGSDYGIAYVTGGSITNNAMTGEDDDNGMFGGGGIYVNGIGDGYAGWHDAELYLSNVEVSNNSAEVLGGGYAACPASVTEINLTNGSVFYGNKADEGANELYILSSTALGTHSGDPSYEVSPSMLGGGAYRWTYDDGSEVPLDQLKGVLLAMWGQELSLGNKLTSDDPGVQRALGLAKVHITGNTSATRGGGIGSNGSVFIGKSVETVEIPVSKAWNDGNDKDGIRPDSIKVDLYRDGEYVGYQTMAPGDDGNWSMAFENLPKNDASGHEYVYTVKEREVEGYATTVGGSAGDGFSLVNRRSVSIPVEKRWEGPATSSVTVRLIANGTSTGDVLELSADNDWKASFDGLAKYDGDGEEIAYTVSEDVPDNYSSAITGDVEGGFTITNTYTPTNDNPPTTQDETPKGEAPKSKKVPLPPMGDMPGSLAPGALAVMGAAALGIVAALRKRHA